MRAILCPSIELEKSVSFLHRLTFAWPFRKQLYLLFMRLFSSEAEPTASHSYRDAFSPPEPLLEMLPSFFPSLSCFPRWLPAPAVAKVTPAEQPAVPGGSAASVLLTSVSAFP